jgi:hypothetical protein
MGTPLSRLDLGPSDVTLSGISGLSVMFALEGRGERDDQDRRRRSPSRSEAPRFVIVF